MMKTMTCPGSARRTVRCVVVVLAVLACLALCGARTVQADPFLDEIIEFNGEVFCVEHNVPALVIGVVRDGKISVRGFGERAGKGSKAPDGNTVIRIGSITKAFNGEVLAHLAAANIVQLAQPLARSWPGLSIGKKADAGHIRLIDLVTHSAGLPREVPREPGPEKGPLSPITVKVYTDWLKKNPLLFSPGRSVHYSNFGFDLLALGLSRAADKSFPALLQHYITGPLDMKDTVFVLSGEQRQRLMQGHGFDGSALPDITVSPINYGAGGLYSTPNDLMKWMRWHLDRFGEDKAEARLLDHSVYLMRDGLATVSGLDESGHMDAMGLAWVAMMPKGDRPFILQKAGGLQGTFSYIAFAPARGVAVFIAINKFDFAAAAAMAGLANDLIMTMAPR